MKITEFKAHNFRNLQDIVLTPDPGINLIYGQNAQGKTNLIEAIWLFSGEKSFRGNKDSRMIRFEEQFATLSLSFDDGEREQHAQIRLGEKNNCTLNRVEQKSLSALAGAFQCVVFSPTHLAVVQGGPSLRRKFLDSAICQIRPDYHGYLGQYERVLAQRNSLLKEIARYSYLRDTIEVWDRQLAKLGTIVTILRQDYVCKVEKFAKHSYAGISSDREQLGLSYQSTAFDSLLDHAYTQDKVDCYFSRLEESLDQDIRQGFTGIGVHRDDLELLINGLAVQTYGSQGQQRSTILALQLAEARLLKSITGNHPVILLDDVMSELDISRQDYLLNHIRENQVFITCCDSSNTLRLQSGRVFHIDGGKLLDEESAKCTST